MGFYIFRLRYGCIKPVKSIYAWVTVCQVNVLKGVCTPTSRYCYHKHGFGYCLIISSLMISLRDIYIYLFLTSDDGTDDSRQLYVKVLYWQPLSFQGIPLVNPFTCWKRTITYLLCGTKQEFFTVNFGHDE